MSETPIPIDPEQAELARLAALDLSLAEHVHAQALASTDPEVINGLGRTYQRVARSLRQTLALKARLAREAREAAARQAAAPQSPWEKLAGGAPGKAYELADAVTKVIWSEREPEEREALTDELCERIDAYIEAPDFEDEPLDAQVVRLAVELGLSPDAAVRWQSLPDLPADEMVYYDLDSTEPP